METVAEFRSWEAIHRPGERQIIFGITADDDDTVLDACLTAGMDDVFQKPIDVAEVLKALRALEDTP